MELEFDRDLETEVWQNLVAKHFDTEIFLKIYILELEVDRDIETEVWQNLEAKHFDTENCLKIFKLRFGFHTHW